MQLLQTILDRKRWIFLTSFMFVLAATTSGYLFYLKFFHPMDRATILRRFENLFYTEEQVAKIQEMTHSATVRPSKEKPVDKCSFTCDKPNGVHSYIALANPHIVEGSTHQDAPERTEKNAHRRIVRSRTHHGTEKYDHQHTGRGRTQQGTTKTRRRYSVNGVHQYNNNNNDDIATTTTTASTTASSSNTSLGNIANDTGNADESKIDRVLEVEENDPRWKHHGCCRSRTRVVRPTRLTSIDGVSVRAVQFNDRQQIYYEESCEQMASCTGCTCYTESRHQVFLVVNDDGGDESDDLDRARLELVAVPGCCKCLNIFSE